MKTIKLEVGERVELIVSDGYVTHRVVGIVKSWVGGVRREREIDLSTRDMIDMPREKVTYELNMELDQLGDNGY